jgi:hypothetical protein
MLMPNTDDRFDLRFKLALSEYYALYYVSKRTLSERVYAALVPAAYWAMGAIIVLPLVFHAPLRQSVMSVAGYYGPPLIIFFIFAIFFVFHRYVLVPAVWRDMLESDGFYGQENRVTVTNSGIAYRAGHVTSKVPWRAVERVVDTYDCIFLFTGRNNAVIVPRRAFANEKKAQRFLAFALKKAGKGK